jgi:predicted O-linked N-acetylglucosamine transferase (SPINDLY family)
MAQQEQGDLAGAMASYGAAARSLRARAARAGAGFASGQVIADRRLAGVLDATAATLLPPIYDSVDEIDRTREQFAGGIARLHAAGVRLNVEHEPVPTLFQLAYQGRDDVELMRAYAALVERPVDPELSTGAREGGRIRVGFVSSLFCEHTIGRLNFGLVQQLDRARFEVSVFSIGDAGDDLARRFRQHADHFAVLPPNPLHNARARIASAGLDMLIYTDIGMDPVSYSLAHSRLARVQCMTWGHPVTSGIPTVDYFISSEALEPGGSEAQYTESLVRLPHPAVYYHRPSSTAASAKSRRDFGFDDGVTLYGCLQMLQKFHPESDEVLGEILRADPSGLVLIVQGIAQRWDECLLARFRRSIPDVAERIRFVQRQPYPDFLALTRACDVMLDPLHFGGGNTTYEALAFGVPVVTLPSGLLRGRITKALYNQMGLDECVADSKTRYVEIASTLGRDRDARRAASERILERADVLFENKACVRGLEDFLVRVADPRATSSRSGGS